MGAYSVNDFGAAYAMQLLHSFDWDYKVNENGSLPLLNGHPVSFDASRPSYLASISPTSSDYVILGELHLSCRLSRSVNE